jgi:hypothetical protein
VRLGVALKICQRPDVLQGNHDIELNVLSMLTPNPLRRNQDFPKLSAAPAALGPVGKTNVFKNRICRQDLAAG